MICQNGVSEGDSIIRFLTFETIFMDMPMNSAQKNWSINIQFNSCWVRDVSI